MKSRIISVLKYLFFLLLGCAILYYLYITQDAAYQEDCIIKGIAAEDCDLIQKVIDDFRSTKLSWLIVISILFMLSNLVRAMRFKDMVASLGNKVKLHNVLFSIMVGYIANLTIPRIGEFARAGSISRYDNVSFETSFGSIVLERIIDVVLLLFCMALTVILGGPTILEYLKSNSIITTNQLSVLAVIAVLAVLGLFFGFRWINRTDSENRFVRFFKEKSQGFANGLKTVSTVENKPMFYFYSVLIWFIYFLMTYLCFFSFQPTENLGLVAGLVAFVFGGIGIAFPSPGGLGSYHFMVSQALILYGINAADSFSFAFILYFTVTIFCNIFFGLISLILLPLMNRNLDGKEENISSSS